MIIIKRTGVQESIVSQLRDKLLNGQKGVKPLLFNVCYQMWYFNFKTFENNSNDVITVTSETPGWSCKKFAEYLYNLTKENKLIKAGMLDNNIVFVFKENKVVIQFDNKDGSLKIIGMNDGLLKSVGLKEKKK